MSELLFYGGVIAIASTVLLSVLAAAFLGLSKAKLNAKLDAEYGKRRR